jgi:CheY-like chemotaxis protein
MMSQHSYDPIESPVAMVAEDDDEARHWISEYLRGKGYGVLEAKTSLEALLLAVDYPYTIDALFTSLDLRKYCNSAPLHAELADCLRASRPEMVIFYLGGEAMQSEGVTRELIQGEAVLLQKPVTAPRLEEALSMVEEERSQTGSAMDEMVHF